MCFFCFTHRPIRLEKNLLTESLWLIYIGNLEKHSELFVFFCVLRGDLVGDMFFLPKNQCKSIGLLAKHVDTEP